MERGGRRGERTGATVPSSPASSRSFGPTDCSPPCRSRHLDDQHLCHLSPRGSFSLGKHLDAIFDVRHSLGQHDDLAVFGALSPCPQRRAQLQSVPQARKRPPQAVLGSTGQGPPRHPVSLNHLLLRLRASRRGAAADAVSQPAGRVSTSDQARSGSPHDGAGESAEV
eukprot:746332-Hanusia_phi.AAC.12